MLWIYYGASIVFALIFVPTLAKMTQLLIDTVTGSLELRRIEKGTYQGIRLGDVSYDETNHISWIIKCLLICVLEIVCIKMYINYYKEIVIAIGFGELLVTMIFEMLLYIIRYFYGADAYLTADGIVSAEGIYRKGECRFAVETEGAAGRKFVNVYREKDQAPTRFQVLEREEEVLQRIELM